MHETKLVIFDCDGVLVESETLANQVYVQMLAEEGHILPLEKTFYEFHGVTLPERIASTAGRYNWNPRPDFLHEFNNRVALLTEKELERIPGVYELIEGIGAPICVASNGSREEIELRLKVSGLKQFFGDAIFSGLEVARPKPAPDVFLAAAEHFGRKPEECIVIEDSIPGVTAAVRAGMKVYGHAAFTQASALKEAGAVPFANMYILKEILDAELNS